MMVSPEDRAVFTHQLQNRRRRGRPRVAPRVATSVKLPEAVYDQLCQVAARDGSSLHQTMIGALEAYAQPSANRNCGSQTNPGPSRAW